MAAPPEIVDALQSVLDIYFSGVRHRERAAFILCDNLVEMACKTRAREQNHRFPTDCGFHTALGAPGVRLDGTPLGTRVQHYRDTRNNLQHASAAATVDGEHCATAMLDSVQVIDHCWPGTSASQSQPWMKCALRIVSLYSQSGDSSLAYWFQEKMRDKAWRGARKSLKVKEIQIQPGARDYWCIAIRLYPNLVEECLNEVGCP